MDNHISLLWALRPARKTRRIDKDVRAVVAEFNKGITGRKRNASSIVAEIKRRFATKTWVTEQTVISLLSRLTHVKTANVAEPDDELTDEDLGINEDEYAETVASFETEMSIRGVIESVVAREREDRSSPPSGHGDGHHSSGDSDDHHDGGNQPPKRKRKIIWNAS